MPPLPAAKGPLATADGFRIAKSVWAGRRSLAGHRASRGDGFGRSRSRSRRLPGATATHRNARNSPEFRLHCALRHP